MPSRLNSRVRSTPLSFTCAMQLAAMNILNDFGIHTIPSRTLVSTDMPHFPRFCSISATSASLTFGDSPGSTSDCRIMRANGRTMSQSSSRRISISVTPGSCMKSSLMGSNMQ